MAGVDLNSSKPPSDREDALAVLKRLRDAGHVAYFAGGCVRDLLLGLPAKDYDVATDAPPSRVRELFHNTQAVGAAFGVILVRHRGSQIEVATFRTDGDYSDGRRPDQVTFTTAEEDAKRRDFTINGLFLDPLANGGEGEVIDYVGGQADLSAKVIRAIGDPAKRFEEDYLRMLRAVRFAARLNFKIEPATADAIRTHAAAIMRISPERIADELRRMLIAPTRAAAWQMLRDLNLQPVIFRTLSTGSGAAVLEALPSNRSISFGLAIAGAVLSYGSTAEKIVGLDAHSIRASTRSIRALLKLSNDELATMDTILGDATLLLRAPTSLAERMRIMARPTASDVRELLAAISAAGYERESVAEIEQSLKPLEQVDCAPAALVTGEDLIASGLSPGPTFKRALYLTYDAQLEHRVTEKSAALQMAIGLAQTR